MPDFSRLAACSGEIVSSGIGEASIKACPGLERVYNEIGRDLSANLLTISTDQTPYRGCAETGGFQHASDVHERKFSNWWPSL